MSQKLRSSAGPNLTEIEIAKLRGAIRKLNAYAKQNGCRIEIHEKGHVVVFDRSGRPLV